MALNTGPILVAAWGHLRLRHPRSRPLGFNHPLGFPLSVSLWACCRSESFGASATTACLGTIPRAISSSLIRVAVGDVGVPCASIRSRSNSGCQRPRRVLVPGGWLPK